MKSSRWDLSFDIAINRVILRTNQDMGYIRFDFIPKAGIDVPVPKRGIGM